MSGTVLPNLMPALPELILAIGGMALLLFGVARKDASIKTITSLAMFVVLIALLALLFLSSKSAVTFGGAFEQDGFAVFMKVLVLVASLAALPISRQYIKDMGIARFEYPVLILFATLGMGMMISAGNFLALYLGLELQALSLYVLAAFNRERIRSTEAGLKYFVLGALSSGLLLYGISLIYGFTHSISFSELGAYSHLTNPFDSAPTGAIVGIVFILSGLAFKVSAAPFHMWTPDVYEGAPTPVTAFFATAPKIAAMALFLRVMMEAFPGFFADWQQIIIVISVASMLVGAFAALMQTNIKRLMAYSSIGHVGFALVGLAAGTVEGIQAVLVYMTIYLTMTLGAFVCILSMRRKEGMAEDIDDLAGLSKTNPAMAFALLIFMFSLTGIPLLAGFFGKWFIFLAAIHAGLIPLAVIGFLTSVVGAVYYLRIVKVMYLDDPAPAFEPNENRSMGIVLAATAIVNSPVSFILIGPLLGAALIAAKALLN